MHDIAVEGIEVGKILTGNGPRITPTDSVSSVLRISDARHPDISMVILLRIAAVVPGTHPRNAG
jgi:hypothetical protein